MPWYYWVPLGYVFLGAIVVISNDLFNLGWWMNEDHHLRYSPSVRRMMVRWPRWPKFNWLARVIFKPIYSIIMTIRET